MKLPLFSVDMTMYITNLKESTINKKKKNLLKLVSDYSKAARHKVIIQKSFASIVSK